MNDAEIYPTLDGHILVKAVRWEEKSSQNCTFIIYCLVSDKARTYQIAFWFIFNNWNYLNKQQKLTSIQTLAAPNFAATLELKHAVHLFGDRIVHSIYTSDEKYLSWIQWRE